jgi:hypothetical protein
MGRYIDLRSDAGGQFADNVGHYRPGASFLVEVALVAKGRKDRSPPVAPSSPRASSTSHMTLPTPGLDHLNAKSAS